MMAMSKDIDRIRHDDDGKGKEITRNLIEVLDGMKLDQAHGQRIVHKAGDLRMGLQKLLKTLAEPVFQFANEVAVSNYMYSIGYTGLKPIEVQIAAISVAFGLDSAKALEYSKHLPELPEGAEGWAIVPSINAVVAKFFPSVTDPTEQYGLAVNLVFGMIAKSRRFVYECKDQFNSHRFRQSTRTTEMLARIAKVQDNSEILLIPIQFGMKYRGYSVRYARERMEDTDNEFGLNIFIVGCLLLTHPEREEVWEQLNVDCSGDEFSSCADGVFDLASSFVYCTGLGFGTHGVDYGDALCGSASGLLPQ
jgi:hypothetical protein